MGKAKPHWSLKGRVSSAAGAPIFWKGLGLKMQSLETGVIVSWFDDRGFGFIRPNSNGEPQEDLFVHAKDFHDAGDRAALNVGEPVRYRRVAGRLPGREAAADAELIEAPVLAHRS